MQHPEYTHTSSINSDGSRKAIKVADVHGRFNRLKKLVYPFLIAILFIAPFIRIGDAPMVLLDIAKRQFFLFGFTFNAQDVYLVFFLLTGAAFSLFFITAIFGRIWCGWACPQTVFLDGVYRRLERWIEGPRQEQLKLSQAPWTPNKIKKHVFKHVLFVLVSVVLAVCVLSYFTPARTRVDLLNGDFAAHPSLVAWFVFLTGILYFNFSWFREQLCVIICPYGRLQSALIDDDSLVIGYDRQRGEPRGKVKDPNRGACINCNRCVVVCPTGIDIRNGLQMECIGCANCIDACDEIMEKIGQEKGLIRYDSLNGLENRTKRMLRPRIYFYTVLLLIGAGVASIFGLNHTSFEANVIRAQGQPYVIEQGTLRNQFEIHLFNKKNQPVRFQIQSDAPENVKITIPFPAIELKALEDRRIPVFASMPQTEFKEDFAIRIRVQADGSDQILSPEVKFLGSPPSP